VIDRDRFLTGEERAFVDTRWRLVRSWPVVCSACLVLLLGFSAWLWLTRPLMINPWAAMAGLESGAIPDATLALMAAMVPVLMLMYLFVLVAGIILSLSVVANERRHIEIIRRLATPRDDASHDPTEGV
jgi:hypothetical protein